MSSQNDNVDLTILLPTYNEALTIQNMLEAIRTNIPDETMYEIIIVDDDSPDGTNEIANSYFEKLENIIKHNVHVRKNKRGLSSAVIDGMKIASGKYVLVMDSDFSHPPEMIRKMYSKITSDDLDIVIGSRYVLGGKCLMKGKRLIFSKYGNLLIKHVLKINCNEFTTSYRGFNLKKLNSFHLNLVTTKGYSFFMGTVNEISKKNFNIKEIPIIFKDRSRGYSKIPKIEILRTLKNLFLLKVSNLIN